MTGVSGTLTSNGVGSPLQITGTATGLDTNTIITAELAQAEQPITNLHNNVSGLQTVNNTLTSIQTALQAVALDAQALGDPGLFSPVQTVTSSNSSLVTASSTTGIGAAVGAASITVYDLASAAQKTFKFISPTAADAVTVDGSSYTLQAGASSSDLINQINSDPNGSVWATVDNAGNVVLSDRQTGNHAGGTYISVSDTTNSLSQLSAQDGQQASYSLDGGTTIQYAATDTVVNPTGLAGVTLTLNGVTPAGSPVTVNVQPPTANTTSISTAVSQFVQDYNSAISQIQTAVSTKPSTASSLLDSGSLFGDPDLESLLTRLRQSIYTPGAGLPSGLAALSDIGVTTGASSGSISQDSLNGKLVVDQTALTQAIQSNPNGVQQVLKQFSQSFQTVTNAVSAPGGTLDSRIQGDSAEMTDLNNQITAMQAYYTQQQRTLQAQWAAVEASIAQLQSQSQAFSSALLGLVGAGSTTSSGSSSSSIA